jgi:hypothetical protein
MLHCEEEGIIPANDGLDMVQLLEKHSKGEVPKLVIRVRRPFLRTSLTGT